MKRAGIVNVNEKAAVAASRRLTRALAVLVVCGCTWADAAACVGGGESERPHTDIRGFVATKAESINIHANRVACLLVDGSRNADAAIFILRL